MYSFLSCCNSSPVARDAPGPHADDISTLSVSSMVVVATGGQLGAMGRLPACRRHRIRSVDPDRGAMLSRLIDLLEGFIIDADAAVCNAAAEHSGIQGPVNKVAIAKSESVVAKHVGDLTA